MTPPPLSRSLWMRLSFLANGRSTKAAKTKEKYLPRFPTPPLSWAHPHRTTATPTLTNPSPVHAVAWLNEPAPWVWRRRSHHQQLLSIFFFFPLALSPTLSFSGFFCCSLLLLCARFSCPANWKMLLAAIYMKTANTYRLHTYTPPPPLSPPSSRATIIWYPPRKENEQIF